LADLDGRTVSAGSVSSDALLIHFFATWCEPCREEFASLARLTEGYPDIKVLAINVAEVPLRVRRFLETVHVPFPVLLDTDRAVTKAWGVSILPTTFVLDRGHAARLFVEGDLDWMHPDVVAALEGVAGMPAIRN
jgi:thiol-disulfide isomerase/thioredoxin